MNQSTFSSPAKEIEQRRRAVQANPRNAEAHALLGMALQKHRHFKEAVASQRRALQLNPKLVALHGVLAAALHELGDYPGAAEAYRRALASQPHDADLQRGLGESLRLCGQADAVLIDARRAMALVPQGIDELMALGLAHRMAGDAGAAADTFCKVTEFAPSSLEAWIERIQAELSARRLDQALRSVANALEQAPRNPGLLASQGTIQRELKQFDAASDSFQRALEIEPDSAAHWCELGIALQSQGRSAEARDMLERSLELAPDRVATLSALTHHYFEAGRWQDALRLVRHTMTLAPSPQAHSTLLFILSHVSADADELTHAHFDYGARWEAPLRAGWKPHDNTRDPRRRVRVGFVSADLRHHAVTRFLEPIFAVLHQSTRLDFFVYSNSKDVDATTARLRERMPNWRDIVLDDDERVERQIRADGIDILIDLSGHSAGNRLPLFARKPAPIQATWIGYAGTTGLQAMDYLVSDQFHLPEGRYDDQFIEQIARLPLIAPFLPPSTSPDVTPLPALDKGYLTFGSFHRASKISRETIALWAKLLRGVPTSKLLLGGQHGGSEAVVLGWLDDEGIARDRILVRPRASVYEYLAQHHEVDVCLSPFPYSGSTTICYALWMGIPTLATLGPTNPSHAAACYLAHLGLSSFLANDDASFVALGRFLEQSTPTLAALRGSMRERFVKSVIGYPGVAAAGLELALLRMWQRWCADQSAAPLRVRLAELEGERQTPQTQEGNA